MIKYSRVWLIVAALLAGLLIAAACGGGGGDGDGDGDGPTATASVDDPGNGDGNGDGDAAAELEGFAQQFANREMKVTYEFTSTIDSSPGSIVIYWKPPDRVRIDILSDDGDISIIQSTGATYLCTPDDGGTCLQTPSVEGALAVPFLSAFTDPENFDTLLGAGFLGADVSRSSDTIAGQDATCYSGTADGGSGEVCFSDEGIMLRVRSTDGTEGDFAMEATDVSGEVSDADLEPPYPILDLGDLIPDDIQVP